MNDAKIDNEAGPEEGHSLTQEDSPAGPSTAVSRPTPMSEALSKRPAIPDTNTNKVLIWVESQDGSAHLSIASRMARQLQNQGIEVTIASSRADEGFDFGDAKRVKLPGYQDINTNITENGILNYKDDAWIKERSEVLQKLYRDNKYGAVIMETWPTYLTPLHDKELTPLLDEASKHGADIYSLTRDIIYKRRKQSESAKSKSGTWGGDMDKFKFLMDRYGVDIIVRGDGNLHRLEETKEGYGKLNNHTFYPGYFARSRSTPLDRSYSEDKEVLVSSGGFGSFKDDAEEFFLNAIKARKHSGQLSKNPWRLFLPLTPDDPAYQKIVDASLKEAPDGKIIVQSVNGIFQERLENAALAIIRGGYTAIEAAAYKTPMVMIPNTSFDQQLRANKFSDLGLCKVAYTSLTQKNDAQSNPETWAKTISDTYENRHYIPNVKIGTYGAQKSVENLILPRLQQTARLQSQPILAHVKTDDMTQKPVHGAILDFDGVLVVPKKNDEIAWAHTMDEMERMGHKKLHNWTIKNKSREAPYAPPDFFNALYGSEELGQKAYGILEKKLYELIPEIEIVEGAKETLSYLRDNHIPTMIASNSPRQYVQAIYDHHFKESNPDALLVGTDDKTPAKPSPEMLYEALNEKGIAASKNVLMIGDGYSTDIPAARAARISPVFIQAGEKRSIPADEKETLQYIDGHQALQSYLDEKLATQQKTAAPTRP